MHTNRTWNLWMNNLITILKSLLADYYWLTGIFCKDGYVTKYITKLNKNNACIYNYTGVYYFLSDRENDRCARCHGAFTFI